jgi:hypothetical protein
VRLLNRALSTPAASPAEADARFAAVLCLTYQSSCMLDGLDDFMTMLRGCVLAGNLGNESIFRTFFAHDYINTIKEEPNDEHQRKMNMCLDDAISSLAALQPLCRPGIERLYNGLLVKLFQAAYFSHRDGWYHSDTSISLTSLAYEVFTQLYTLLGVISLSDFQELLDPTNSVARILLCHFLATHVLLRRITVIETGLRNLSAIYGVMAGWLKNIHDGLDPHWQKLNHWPLSLVKGSLEMPIPTSP